MMVRIRRRFPGRWYVGAAGLAASILALVRLAPGTWPAVAWSIAGALVVLFVAGLSVPETATILGVAFVLTMLFTPARNDHNRWRADLERVEKGRASAPSPTPTPGSSPTAH